MLFEIRERIDGPTDARGGEPFASPVRREDVVRNRLFFLAMLVALTAFARSEDRATALGHGFQKHVAKPVHPSELVLTIATMLGR